MSSSLRKILSWTSLSSIGLESRYWSASTPQVSPWTRAFSTLTPTSQFRSMILRPRKIFGIAEKYIKSSKPTTSPWPDTLFSTETLSHTSIKSTLRTTMKARKAASSKSLTLLGNSARNFNWGRPQNRSQIILREKTLQKSKIAQSNSSQTQS